MDKYKAMIRAAGFEFDVDPHMIHAVILVESSGRPDAMSPCGAAGLMQLMPGTFVEMAQLLHLPKPDIWDPAQNVRCGTCYLRLQYKKFPSVREVLERWQFALAAYNCGAGYVQIALRLAEIEHGAISRCWLVASRYLSDPRCEVNGKRPLAADVIDHVHRVMAEYYKAQSLHVYTAS